MQHKCNANAATVLSNATTMQFQHISLAVTMQCQCIANTVPIHCQYNADAVSMLFQCSNNAVPMQFNAAPIKCQCSPKCCVIAEQHTKAVFRNFRLEIRKCKLGKFHVLNGLNCFRYVTGKIDTPVEYTLTKTISVSVYSTSMISS